MRDGLLAHLRPLERQGIITWHDRQILPGTRWDEEIKARLNAADIILLLLSSDFLATDYCTQVEIPEALRRHEAGEATVMPVILRHCGWQFTDLAAIQAYPEKAKPIKSWTDIDEAFTDVVNGVYLAAKEIKSRRDQQRQAAEQNQTIEAPVSTPPDRPSTVTMNFYGQVTGVAGNVQGNQWVDRPTENRSPDSDDLSSDRHIDYTRLRDLLKAGKWREADQETDKKMREVMGRQKDGWLRVEDIEQFPCTDLRTIDRLWVKYSNGKFGFSVQKQIWQEYGSPTKYNANWEKFGDRVGWRAKGFLGLNNKWLDYTSMTFSTSAPVGHLPFLLDVSRVVRWKKVFVEPDVTNIGGWVDTTVMQWKGMCSLLSREDL